jgi:hypothetical protein
MVPPKFIAVVSAMLSIVGLVLFVLIYGFAVWRSWHKGPLPDSNMEYVATALAGLVGGFVAAAFGQKLPGRENGDTSFIRAGATRLGHLVTASRAELSATDGFGVRDAIGVAYVIAYFVVGLAAGVTWLFAPETAPDLIKNLAMIVLGLIIAIAGTY